MQFGRFLVAGVAVMAMGAGACMEIALAEPAAATSPSTTSKPATATASAKREKPLTIGGNADARAPGYIVLFENDVDAATEVARLKKLYGFKNQYVYSMPGFKGFAAKMTKEAVEKLRWEINVKSIEHDGAAGIDGGGEMGAK